MLHPSLTLVCPLPANPAELTREQVQAICGGDIDAVLREIVALAVADDRTPERAGAA